MNVAIISKFCKKSDIDLLFGGEEVYAAHIDSTWGLPQLLRELGIYKSAKQAIQAGRTGEIPKGWTVMKASKKIELFIWNPTE